VRARADCTVNLILLASGCTDKERFSKLDKENGSVEGELDTRQTAASLDVQQKYSNAAKAYVREN